MRTLLRVCFPPSRNNRVLLRLIMVSLNLFYRQLFQCVGNRIFQVIPCSDPWLFSLKSSLWPIVVFPSVVFRLNPFRMIIDENSSELLATSESLFHSAHSKLLFRESFLPEAILPRILSRSHFPGLVCPNFKLATTLPYNEEMESSFLWSFGLKNR